MTTRYIVTRRLGNGIRRRTTMRSHEFFVYSLVKLLFLVALFVVVAPIELFINFVLFIFTWFFKALWWVIKAPFKMIGRLLHIG